MWLRSTSASCHARVNQKGFDSDFSGITVDSLVETNLSLCFRNWRYVYILNKDEVMSMLGIEWPCS